VFAEALTPVLIGPTVGVVALTLTEKPLDTLLEPVGPTFEVVAFPVIGAE